MHHGVFFCYLCLFVCFFVFQKVSILSYIKPLICVLTIVNLKFSPKFTHPLKSPSSSAISAVAEFLAALAVDVFGWPKSQCMFPAWTTRSAWRDITSRHVYSTNDMGDVIDIGYRSSATSPVEISTSLRCYRILARNTTASHVTVIAFAITACSAKYQCISFAKRKDSVIELHKGIQLCHLSTPSMHRL